MTNYYSILLIIFGILAYMILIDENVGQALLLGLKIVKIKCTTAYLYVWLHPKNPFFRYASWRRSQQLANEFQKMIEEMQNDKVSNVD